MIKQLNLVNFRGHTRELMFCPGHNLLSGPNESGKSTVKEGIAFAWYGTDSSGSKSPDHLITEGQEVMEVALVTEHVTLVRRKRRGQTSTIKLTRHGYPPVTMTQTDLQNLLKISLDAFMCCWNVGYFMSLTPQSQVAVLGELARLDRRALLLSMLPEGTQVPAKVKLVNPKIDADALASERRQVQNVRASDEGALKQVQAQLAELKAAEPVDRESYEVALNKINAELESHDFYRKALVQYNKERSSWDLDVARVPDLKKELATLAPAYDMKTDPRLQEVSDLYTQVKEMRAEVEVLRAKLKPMHPPPSKPKGLESGGTCTHCGQEITEAHAAKVMAAYEAELMQYNRAAREHQDQEDAVRGMIRSLSDDAEAKIRLAVSAETAMHAQRDQAAKASGRRQVIEAELKRVAARVEPKAPQRPAGDEEALRKEQLELNTALMLARKQSTQVEGLLAQEKLLQANLELHAAKIRGYQAIEKALLDLPGVETRKLLESLTVDGVTVNLMEGKIVVLGANQVPYPSLSSGRKMKVDLSFCRSLREAADKKAPSWIFLDNADLMDQWRELLPTGVQVFTAKVDGSKKDLTVIHL